MDAKTLTATDGQNIYYETSISSKRGPRLPAVGEAETLLPRSEERENQGLRPWESISDPEHPALLFLHGIVGDLDAWQFITPQLTREGYNIITVDLRGHGYSGHPQKQRDYTLERVAKDVYEIAGKENLKKFV